MQKLNGRLACPLRRSFWAVWAQIGAEFADMTSTDTPTSQDQPRLARLLTYAEMEALTGIKRNTLYAMVSKKQIPHVRLSRRIVRFREDEVRRWISLYDVPSHSVAEDGCEALESTPQQSTVQAPPRPVQLDRPTRGGSARSRPIGKRVIGDGDIHREEDGGRQ